MTVPILRLSSASPSTVVTDILVIAVAKTTNGPVLLTKLEGFDGSTDALSAMGVTGAIDEVLRCAPATSASKSIALVGLGAAEISPDTLRYAAGSATRQLRGVDSIALALPATSDADLDRKSVV